LSAPRGPLRITLGGVTGWVGRPLAAAIATQPDMRLVAAVARGACCTPLGHGDAIAPIAPTVRAALDIPSDVYVDYTSAEAVLEHSLTAISEGRHVVIGSSGLGTDEYRAIDAAARAAGVGVVAVGNFSTTAALLQRFAADAAQHLPTWEILDFADARKIDAPSGTARELAWRLSTVRAPHVAVPTEHAVGPREAYGAAIDGTRVHSVRLPGHGLGVEIHFGHGDERLVIRYEAGASASPYIAGTLRAIRRVREFQGLVRGGDELL